ncbi:MAG: IS256 family transposase [Acidobacteriota bacterium]|nr:MAG: IS256 family transposase [Acidobacteriota bacterium]
MGSDTPKSKLGKVIQIDEGQLKDQLGALVRESVEETLNGMLDAEAERLCQAKRYERNAERASTRAGHYERKLQTKAGEVTLRMPKLRSVPFETAIIERYRRRESSVEEALIEMYLAGVSVRRVEDITEALWGTRVSPGTVSKLNQKIYEKIDAWRTRPLTTGYPYVFLDGIWLKRSWGGEVRNVSILVAIAVAEDGFREVIGAVEGAKEDKESWGQFLRHLKDRGLKGVQLVISDKCLGLVESVAATFPDARWQRCVVHFYRNVFTVVPKGKVRDVAAMLKAIHAQEDHREAHTKAQAVVKKLVQMKLKKAAELLQEGVGETLSYYRFPREHWRHVKTNNPLERILREVRRRTRVVGAFPDGRSALMLVAARLRHIAGPKWGTKKYVDTGLLEHATKAAALQG